MRHTANILGGQPGWSGDQEIRNIPTYPATGLGLAQILCINQCMILVNTPLVKEKMLQYGRYSQDKINTIIESKHLILMVDNNGFM